MRQTQREEWLGRLVADLMHGCVIRKHQATDTVSTLNVGGLLSEGDLDGGWGPGDEVG